MDRIIAQTTITNRLDGDKSIQCGRLVDTGADALILPRSWKDRLGNFLRSEPVQLMLANQEVIRGEACAPVEIKIDGFRPIWNEVVFTDFEGQTQASVDLLGHRLVPVQSIDMK